MNICLRLGDWGAGWERKMTAVLTFTGPGKGAWRLTKGDQAGAPWGLLALDCQGTFGYRAALRALEFFCTDARDGRTTLCFTLFDAPASLYDESRLRNDGDVYKAKDPVGETCELSWNRLFETA
jgi:hypothetical protein